LVGFISSRTTLPTALLCLVVGLLVVVLTVSRLNGAEAEESGAGIQEPGGQG